MIGTALKTFCTSLNGDAEIDDTLLTVLLNSGKAIFEAERDWRALRKTNSSLSATTAGTWQTALSLAGITDFGRFYGDFPIKLFDGTNRVEKYRQVPFDRRLDYKDVDNTFCYDIATGNFYLNGTVTFSGTLYIDYVLTSIDIDLTSAVDLQTSGMFPFPGRFHPLLAFYAVGMNKGAIDYDSINREMLPSNQATLIALKNAIEKWDTNLQLDEQMQTDPSGNDMGPFRSNHININA